MNASTLALTSAIAAVKVNMPPWRTRKALPAVKYAYWTATMRRLTSVRKGAPAWTARYWAQDMAEARSQIHAILTGATVWTDRDGVVWDHELLVVADPIKRHAC